MSTPVFIDTSAIYAMLDVDDVNHESANRAFQQLMDGLESDDLEAVTMAPSSSRPLRWPSAVSAWAR